jgi:acetaldehyde dehydrogenase/alcohol dehydrogenase
LEKTFYDKLDSLVEQAFDDHCTGANPAYPLMEDIKTVLIKAYN